MEIEVNCEFKLLKWSAQIKMRYSCHILSKTIPEETELKFVGQHEPEKTNADVTGIYFENCEMPKFPRGLMKNFPNLETICISNSKLQEVKNEDLIEFKNLKEIYLPTNLIEFLPADLFRGLEEMLEWIGFWSNKLKVIEPTILDGFNDGNLKHVDFRENPNYTNCYSTLIPSVSTATLDVLKNELFEKYYSNFRKMMNEKSELADKIMELEAENHSLKLQNAQNEEIIKDLKVAAELKTDMKTFTETDEDLKDFTIKIDDSEFRVHKFAIAARSSTLADILRNNQEAESLNLTDVSVNIFELILKYFYSDELPNGDDVDFMELFAASGRLQVEVLKEFAAEKLITQTSPENAMKILKLSNKYEHEKLRKEAFEAIKKSRPEFEFEDGWSTDVEKLEKVLQLIDEKEILLKQMEEKFKALRSN